MRPAEPLALQALTPEAMVRAIPGVPLGHARKLVAQIHRDEVIHTASQVSRASVELLRERGHVPTLEVVEEAPSQVDPFVKYVLRTPDGQLVEAVRIPLHKERRFSVCVSSQVGCALACAFCATGRLGLTRNLETWEMVEQVRVVHRGLKRDGLGRVHGVVFQGMGEPLSNLDRVLVAIDVLSEPTALSVDQRAITVSTSGLPVGIRRLAREAPKVRLAWSLHSARAPVRRNLMPIDAAHPLEEVFDAVAEHAVATGYAPLWSITPLLGINDDEAEARAVAELAVRFAERTGVRPRISIIPYNRIDTDERDPFRRSTDERAARFRTVMTEYKVFPIERYSGAGDVGGACGQLARSARECDRASVGTPR
ncbi:MAG: 23S rRNA (adenine(2503)-C(2))-methyltransferase RlmN [Myxococcota bacterium]